MSACKPCHTYSKQSSRPTRHAWQNTMQTQYPPALARCGTRSRPSMLTPCRSNGLEPGWNEGRGFCTRLGGMHVAPLLVAVAAVRLPRTPSATGGPPAGVALPDAISPAAAAERAAAASPAELAASAEGTAWSSAAALAVAAAVAAAVSLAQASRYACCAAEPADPSAAAASTGKPCSMRTSWRWLK